MSDNTEIAQKFAAVKEGVLAVELDVAKAVAGNTAAGLRVRKALRVINKELRELVKKTTEADKAVRAERKAAKASKPA